jgi:beta-glucoside operon transcriptional antiterminator
MDGAIFMTVMKIFNSNAVLVKDDKERIGVATGKGIGFNKKIGERILIEEIETLFIEYNETVHHLVQTYLT